MFRGRQITGRLLRRVLELPREDKEWLAGKIAESIEGGEAETRLEEMVGLMERVSGQDIRQSSRKSKAVTARSVLVWVAREEGYTQCEIGAAISRNHSTIFSMEKKMQDAFAYPALYKGYIELYETFIKAVKEI